MTRVFALLVVSCAVGGVAWANETGDEVAIDEQVQPAVTVLYTGVDASPIAAGQATALVGLLSGSSTPPATALHVEETFPGFELQVFDTGPHQTCQATPLTVGTYRDRVEALYQATTQLEDTDDRATSLKVSQACLAEPADPTELARVPFLQGVTAFSDGDGDAAEAAFAEVFVIDPDYEWDPEYPPDAQLAFANAGTEVMRLGMAQLAVLALPGAELWIDGRSADPLRPIQVIPGRHLVQLRTATNQPIRGVVVEVPADDGAQIISPATLGDPSGPDVGLAALNTAREIAGEPTIDWFVQLWPTLTAYSWDKTTASVNAVSIPPSVAATVFGTGPSLADSNERRARALPVVVGVGASMVVAGAVLAAVGGNEAQGIASNVEAGMPFVHPDDTAPTAEQQANTNAFNRARNAAGVGVGMMAAGSVALAITIPMKIKLERGRREADVAVSAVIGPPQSGHDLPSGFGIRVTIR